MVEGVTDIVCDIFFFIDSSGNDFLNKLIISVLEV